MKKAVVLVGERRKGKSLTIKCHLKPMLKRPTGQILTSDEHVFKLHDKRGFILSQSFEEAGRDVEATIKKYSNYDLLVLAAWSTGYRLGSKLEELLRVLRKYGFTPYQVRIMSPTEAPEKAREIFRILNS